MSTVVAEKLAEQLVERITSGPDTVAILVRRGYDPAETTFLTPPGLTQQVGFVAHPAGSEIPRYTHLPLQRSVCGTPKCVIVRSGRSEVTLYDARRHEVARRVLEAGDILLLVSGGHGFRQLEDTVFLEVKQGPYPGVEEKKRF